MKKKRIKVFGAKQKIDHPVAVENFLRELVAEPPKSAKKLEQRKKDAYRKTYNCIVN